MINSIPKIESKKVLTFENLGQNRLPSDFWLPAKDTVEIQNQTAKEEVKPQKTSASSSQGFTITTPDKARKTKNLTTIGLSVAAATVLSAGAIFFILKGGTKGLTKKLEGLRDYFERQLLKSKLNNEGEMTLTSKVYVSLIKSFDAAARNFEAVNNFTTLKDVLFKKVMSVHKFWRKIHDNITKLFERFGRQSVLNSYKETAGRRIETKLLRKTITEKILTGDSFKVVEINGVKRTKAQWLGELSRLDKEMNELYDGTFSYPLLSSRYSKFKRAANELGKDFESLKVFWTKDFFLQFMSESKILKEKESVKRIVHKTRRAISYSLADLVQDTNDLIMKMTGLTSFKDVEKIRNLRRIKTDIRSFATTANQDPNLKAKILKDIAEFKNSLIKDLSDSSKDKKMINELLENVDYLNDYISNFKQGKVEDMLDIYRALLPSDSYEKIAKSYKNNIKSLDKSIRLETEEFVNKLRDLATGSAPTDILTMLGAVGVLGYQIGKSDDKEQKASIILKYGIPAIVGQIGVTLYCNAKLFAGTKSLLIGTLSSLVLNRIGEWADNSFKRYRANKKNKADTAKNVA